MTAEDRAPASPPSSPPPARATLFTIATNDRLVRLVLVLLAAALILHLYNEVMRLGSLFSHTLLLFILSWLLALALSPAVTWLSRLELRVRARLAPAGQAVAARVRRDRGASAAAVAESPPAGPLHRPLAAAVVYGGLGVAFVLALVYIVPVLLAQLEQLRQSVPALVAAAPGWLEEIRRWAEPYGLAPTLTGALDPESIRNWLSENGLAFAQNALGIVSQIASLSVDLFMILTLSVYMLLDGDKALTGGIRRLPVKWQTEGRLLVATIGVKFGGFLRTVVVQSTLFGAAVFIVMQLFGLPYSLIVALLSGVLMIVPVVGGLLAVYLPTIVALVVTRSLLTAVAFYAVVWIYQMILYNAIMPRLIGDIMGLPPLLAFAALLVGGTVGGVWGALFSAPVAAVGVALVHFLRQRQRVPGARRRYASSRGQRRRKGKR